MNLKPWMKALMWFGLGGGIGFFAGYGVGMRTGNSTAAKMMNDADEDVYEARRKLQETKDALDLYSGGKHVEDPEEEAEMPEDPPEIGDEEEIEGRTIPELHPQHLIPERITEEEYYENPWGDDQEQLLYYEGDRVLFNKNTRKALKTPDAIDQAIGLAMILSFYRKDGEVLDAIFVRNPTMGVIFRIDRLEASYEEEGGDPEYEEDDD